MPKKRQQPGLEAAFYWKERTEREKDERAFREAAGNPVKSPTDSTDTLRRVGQHIASPSVVTRNTTTLEAVSWLP